jgi:hypothetical protein
MQGERSWEGPTHCGPQWDGDTNFTYLYDDCPKKGHLHCDGPLSGTTVRYEKKGRTGPLFAEEAKSGIGVVAVHWHYEGCMIEVGEPEFGTERVSLCPDLGDTVMVVESSEPVA